MLTISARDIEMLVSEPSLAEEHHVELLMLEASLEDAALGGIEGISALRTGPYKGRVSRLALEQAERSAQRTGRSGEEYVFTYLKKKQSAGLIQEFVWEADENAISPYDFLITEMDGTHTLIGVKSTAGNFANSIHISFNELLQMCDVERYDLYRVFGFDEDTAQLRIAEQVNAFAKNVVQVLKQLPGRVRSDGISVPPTELDFGEIVLIALSDEG